MSQQISALNGVELVLSDACHSYQSRKTGKSRIFAIATGNSCDRMCPRLQVDVESCCCDCVMDRRLSA